MPTSIASLVIWVASVLNPATGMTTSIGYVDTSRRNCETIYSDFDPETTNVELAYDMARKRCFVRVKQMTQMQTSMALLGDD